MRQFKFLTLVLTILVGLPTAGLLAGDPATLPDSLVADSTADGKFLVHEWGTFTTFSGSDGVFMDYRPLAPQHSDLPYYVLDRGSYAPQFSKGRLFGRVRMETPVTYFYTDRVRTVDVRVDFPQGLLTEFYPPVKSMLPAIDQKNIFREGEVIGNSSLHWGQVDLIPVDQLLPQLANDEVRNRLTNNMVHNLIPHAANEQHYAAARETDAALVHVRAKAGLHGSEASFFEKFLFYRGVGKFQLPISAKFSGLDVVISNDGELPMNSAILIHVDGDRIFTKKIDRLEAGQTQTFDDLVQVSVGKLSAFVEEALVAEGLYEKEAAAMVKTWQQSWFSEAGTRVLYMVPPTITDELLPLYVTPRPQESVRVLVGRMEIMSPADEARMTAAVAASAQARAEHFAQPLAEGQQRKPYHIPASVHDYGRMAEPALVRVSKITTDAAVRQEAEMLINQYRSQG